MSGEVPVTQELQAKFDQIFGGDSEDASTPESDGSAKGPTAQQRQREEEEAEELVGLDGATADDTKGYGEDEQGKEPEGVQKTADESQGKSGDEKDDGVQKTLESTLPAYLRHAAKRAEISDADLAKLMEVNPTLATNTLEKLHGQFSDLGARYGQMGQQAAMYQHGKTSSVQQPNPEVQWQEKSGLDQYLQSRYGENLGNLNEKYGEGFVDDVLKPLAGPVQRIEAEYAEKERQAIASEVGNFFSSRHAELGELYGKDAGKITADQDRARQEVGQMADWIREGAYLSNGIRLSVSDALDYAVAQHSAPQIALLERKRLTAELTNRSKQMTSRPTHRNVAPSKAEQPKTIEAAMSAYTEKAGQLGFDLNGY